MSSSKDILGVAMVRAQALTKVFPGGKKPDVLAVSNLSFQASPNQVFGLLGVNGAGKTTALRLLSTVLSPTSGTATVSGHDVVGEADAVRRSIGFMSASTALYGRLTPREVLEFFGTLNGMAGDTLKSRVGYLIERFDIGDFADRLCDKLSTGQKQRVSIARTVVHDPPVLVFDEPTAGLDVLTSQSVLRYILSERDRGKTILFSTHQMSEAERICDVVAVIHRGTLRDVGPVSDLKSRAGAASLEDAFLKLVGPAEETA